MAKKSRWLTKGAIYTNTDNPKGTKFMYTGSGMKKLPGTSGSVQVRSHMRAGKKVRSYTRGVGGFGKKFSGGALGRTLKHRAKGIVAVAKTVHAIGNPTNRSLSNIIKDHKNDFNNQAKYMRRGIDRKGYKGGGKLSYLISATASKKIK